MHIQAKMSECRRRSHRVVSIRKGESWLPILHTVRNGRHYTALFSNTARAHEQGKTDDWVVLFCDNGDMEHRFTAITSEFGRLQGQRIVAGREAECEKYYQGASTSLPDGAKSAGLHALFIIWNSPHLL
jgi:hypothetical protein